MTHLDQRARWSIPFAIAVMAVAIVLTEIGPESPAHSDASFLTGIVSQTVVAAALVVLVWRLGLARTAGYGAPRPWRTLLLTWPLVALTLLNAVDLLTGTLEIDTTRPMRILAFVALFFSTGLFEEMLCRGFMLNLFLTRWGGTHRGTLVAVLLSSALFGLAHLTRVVTGQASLAMTAVQVTYAFLLGVLFAAIFVRTGSIWPGVALHALFDIAGSFPEIAVGGIPEQATSMSLADAGASIGLCALPCLYGLFLLRAKRSPDSRNALAPTASPALAQAFSTDPATAVSTGLAPTVSTALAPTVAAAPSPSRTPATAP